MCEHAGCPCYPGRVSHHLLIFLHLLSLLQGSILLLEPCSLFAINFRMTSRDPSSSRITHVETRKCAPLGVVRLRSSLCLERRIGTLQLEDLLPAALPRRKVLLYPFGLEVMSADPMVILSLCCFPEPRYSRVHNPALPARLISKLGTPCAPAAVSYLRQVAVFTSAPSAHGIDASGARNNTAIVPFRTTRGLGPPRRSPLAGVAPGDVARNFCLHYSSGVCR